VPDAPFALPYSNVYREVARHDGWAIRIEEEGSPKAKKLCYDVRVIGEEEGFEGRRVIEAWGEGIAAAIWWVRWSIRGGF
jgi:hypothetical protein